MLSSPSAASALKFADKLKMQHRLFAELSRMFGAEVPLYDKSLLVNRECNKAVCDLLSRRYLGFSLSDEQLDKTSGERHGAIRIGTPEEYKWIAGYFAAFAMEPHNFYDMTALGGKSQPIIATAFRSPLHPEHRVFCSLLMLDGFDPGTRARVNARLSQRQVFSERARELVIKNEEQGGLDDSDAEELVQEGINRIFKWTGKAHDFALYKLLCDTGFKIAADIACFDSHHLNHLTPNTFCMDLYTAAMKFCLGESDEDTFRRRAIKAFNWLNNVSDQDYMKLHFRHLTLDDIKAFGAGDVTQDAISELVTRLIERLSEDTLQLQKLKHSGFKDFTEGPPADTPILLRQDSYKALTEPVVFVDPDGSTVDAVHTARFGEIEQRFYATTPEGRALYDQCLANAEIERAKNPELAKQDYEGYQDSYASAFASFPKTLPELLKQKLVYGRYFPTAKGKQERGRIGTTDINTLVADGYVQFEGVRYEDFLPFSAAGIFASNLGQYGTKSAAVEKPTYSKATLEEIMGRQIVDPNTIYKGIEADSLLETYTELDLLDKLDDISKKELESARLAYSTMQAAER